MSNALPESTGEHVSTQMLQTTIVPGAFDNFDLCRCSHSAAWQPNAVDRLCQDPLMQCLGVGDAPLLTDLGVIPRQPPFLQNNPPPVVVVANDSDVAGLTGCSRSSI
jgi:hypothetical protein